MINQCDGCVRGLQKRNGLHVDENNRAVMACTAERYDDGWWPYEDTNRINVASNETVELQVD